MADVAKINSAITHNDGNDDDANDDVLITTNNHPTPFRIIEGLRDIVDQYDVFLLDMWGVMHDGTIAYDGVEEVVQRLHEYNKNMNNNKNTNTNNNQEEGQEEERNTKKPQKQLIIVSNSSKRRTKSIAMLHTLGFAVEEFEEIITSGEIAHHVLHYLATSSSELSSSSRKWRPQQLSRPFQELRNHNLNTKHNTPNKKAFCFGSGENDAEYLHSCGWDLETQNITHADVIIARGTFVIHYDDTHTTPEPPAEPQSVPARVVEKTRDAAVYWSTYHAVLAQAAACHLPMIVCNPDKVRPDAEASPMPGTIGLAYEQLLQQYQEEEETDTENNSDKTGAASLILYLGKPFRDVYDIALSSLSIEDENNDTGIDKARVVMIGDALETDVTGAAMSGIDSVWVIEDGIHKNEVQQAAAAAVPTTSATDTDTDTEDDTSSSHNTDLRVGCEKVLEEINNRSETTYANGRQIAPTYVIPHFRW